MPDDGSQTTDDLQPPSDFRIMSSILQYFQYNDTIAYL